MDRHRRAVSRQTFAPLPRQSHRSGTSSQFRVPPEALAALATVSLGLINLIGPLGVLLFIGCSFLLMVSQPLFNLGQLIRFSPLLLLPLLAIISTMWSTAPSSTMRSALELMLTFVAAIIVCQNMRPDRSCLRCSSPFRSRPCRSCRRCRWLLSANIR